MRVNVSVCYSPAAAVLRVGTSLGGHMTHSPKCGRAVAHVNLQYKVTQPTAEMTHQPPPLVVMSQQASPTPLNTSPHLGVNSAN